MPNELFQTLFIWEALSLPVITLDGDTILYRNEWAALRFPSATEGADIRTILGELGYRKLQACTFGEDTTLLVDGVSYDMTVVPGGALKSLVFVGSQRAYRFSGYHELSLLIPDLRDEMTDLLTCAGMLDGAKPSVRGILLRAIHRILRRLNTLRYLTELRVGEMQITPTLLDLTEALGTVAALWQTIPDVPTLSVDVPDAFCVFFDRQSAVTLLCRLLTLAHARCTAADAITLTVAADAATFVMTVTDTGSPYADDALAALNCRDACNAAESRLPASQALDAAVVWMLATSLGGTVRYDRNAVSVTLPYAPNVTPTPDRPTMQMEFSVSAGVDHVRTELAGVLPSATYVADGE